jgi:hypothetical protein
VQGFLAKRRITATTQVDAKKQTINGEQSLTVLAGVDHLHVAKGKRVVHVDLRKDRPAKGDLLELLLGPTGNLRAPTIRKGRTLLVGFDEATYKQVLG